MKAKINVSKKANSTNYYSHLTISEDKHEIDGFLTKVLTEIKVGQLLEETKKGNYAAIPKKRVKLAKRLQAMINDTYGGKIQLVQSIDEWIKLVSLNIEEENRIGNQTHLDLLFFLFTFKELLQFSIDDNNFINRSLDFVYGLFGRKHLAEEIFKWIRLIALSTEKKNYTGSEEYLELLNFLFIFNDALLKKQNHEY